MTPEFRTKKAAAPLGACQKPESAKVAVGDTARIVAAVKADTAQRVADVNALDRARYARHYAQDAVAMLSGRPNAVRPAAIQVDFARALAAVPDLNLVLLFKESVDVSASGDLAVSRGTRVFTATDPGPQAGRHHVERPDGLQAAGRRLVEGRVECSFACRGVDSGSGAPDEGVTPHPCEFRIVSISRYGPGAYRPTMTASLVPPDLLDRVVAYFDPRRVILFGSRARGDTREDSDIDLMVILDDDAPPALRTLKAGYESRRGYNHAVDVIPVREAAYRNARRSPAPWPTKPRRMASWSMSAPDEPSPAFVEAERRAEAKRWLAIAQDDLDVSLAARNLPKPRAGIAAYHLQQAAEKVFKAMLVLSGQRLRRIHDLDELAEELAPLYPGWRERLEALRPLTVWGIAYRYPGAEDEPEPEPDVAELEQAAATPLPEPVGAALLRGDSFLKAVRRWRGRSQTALAVQTGIGQGYLSDLEHRRRAGTPETFGKLAAALDVPMSWLTTSAT